MKVKLFPRLQSKKSLFVFFFIFFVLLLSLPHVEKQQAPDYSQAFAVYILLFSLSIRISNIKKSIPLICAIIWMVGSTFYSIAAGTLPASNVLVQPNAAILAIPLMLATNKKLSIDMQNLLPLILRLVLLSAAVKYTLSLLFLVNDRPFLFHENNFELPFFIIIYLLVHDDIKINLDFALLTLVCISSGSLSGTTSYLLVILFRKSFIKYLPHVMCVILIFLITPAGQKFIDRASDIASEERVTWLFEFAEARQEEDREVIEILSTPQALPKAFCQLESRWNRDEVGKDVCYSEVLHGNVFRMIVDFGLLPAAAFIAGFWWMICGIFGFPRGTLYFLLVFLNGLSVSGFANEMLIAAIALGYSITGGGRRQLRMPDSEPKYGS